ncbi:oxidoreductase-like domain-containing protein [Pontibacter sp. JAM-7]
MSVQENKPVPPGDNECCESGCTPCVWDTYYEDLQAWQNAQKPVSKPEDS